MGTFDQEMQQASPPAIRTFNGYPAVTVKGTLPGSEGKRITHSLFIRVPGGTLLLAIATTPESQQQSMRSAERFYWSLSVQD